LTRILSAGFGAGAGDEEMEELIEETVGKMGEKREEEETEGDRGCRPTV